MPRPPRPPNRNRSEGGEPRRSGPSGSRPRPPQKGMVWRPGPSARQVGSETGMDLAHFIALGAKGELSVRAIRRALDAGSCRVNGQVETFGSRILKKGEIVEFFIPAKRPQDHDFEEQRVLLDADGVFAYDKPAGLPVTANDAGKKWNLERLLRDRFGMMIAVHRLDADTSGVVLFARTSALARKLEESFREHLVEKTYLALVRGQPRETGTYRSYLIKKGEQKGQERWASGHGADAREAVTNWEVEERVGKWASLVRVKPTTGRYHQIRIHFSEMGHPIFGDRIYGDRSDQIHITRHLLHAFQVDLPHPVTGEKLSIVTPFPEEFTQAITLLKKL